MSLRRWGRTRESTFCVCPTKSPVPQRTNPLGGWDGEIYLRYARDHRGRVEKGVWTSGPGEEPQRGGVRRRKVSTSVVEGAALGEVPL